MWSKYVMRGDDMSKLTQLEAGLRTLRAQLGLSKFAFGMGHFSCYTLTRAAGFRPIRKVHPCPVLMHVGTVCNCSVVLACHCL